MPPPIQREATPILPSSWSRALISVTTIRVPEAPIGWLAQWRHRMDLLFRWNLQIFDDRHALCGKGFVQFKDIHFFRAESCTRH